jgi:glucose-1-phosphate thymidylyltransferase
VGPNVSIEAGSVVRDSVVKNAIVGRNCRLDRVKLDGAMLGDDVVVEGFMGSASLGSHAEVRV